jgi:hypothetical protein
MLGEDYKESSRRLIGERTVILCLSCIDRVRIAEEKEQIVSVSATLHRAALTES